MISIKTIQKCQQGDKEFSKQWFIKILQDNISQEEFNRFCREIMLLNERYVTTTGLTVTDRPDLIIPKENVTWELTEIDFDQPITFREI